MRATGGIIPLELSSGRSIMTRKLIALGVLVLVAALVGGAAAVAACVVAADHTAPVPAAERSGDTPNPATTSDGTAADLTNWQEVRVVVTGSKFK